MKSSSLLVAGLAAAMAGSLPAVADDAHHPAKADPPAATQAKAPAPEQTVKKMQGNVKKMQAQLDRLGKAKNEAEAQAILAEHMQTMRENMMLGRGMAGMGCQMMGGGMMGQGMQGQGMQDMMGGEAMMQRMQQMEQRMDRMQSMLDQMAKPATAK